VVRGLDSLARDDIFGRRRSIWKPSVISHTRQQQYRRFVRAAAATAAAVASSLLALLAVGVGAAVLAGLLLIVTCGLTASARYWFRLAARSRVGARSEQEAPATFWPVYRASCSKPVPFAAPGIAASRFGPVAAIAGRGTRHTDRHAVGIRPPEPPPAPATPTPQQTASPHCRRSPAPPPTSRQPCVTDAEEEAM
jgi:hypothetical protein